MIDLIYRVFQHIWYKLQNDTLRRKSQNKTIYTSDKNPKT